MGAVWKQVVGSKEGTSVGEGSARKCMGLQRSTGSIVALLMVKIVRVVVGWEGLW